MNCITCKYQWKAFDTKKLMCSKKIENGGGEYKCVTKEIMEVCKNYKPKS